MRRSIRVGISFAANRVAGKPALNAANKAELCALLAARFPIAMEGILVLFILHRTDLPAESVRKFVY
jgi:hypothetical protein